MLQECLMTSVRKGHFDASLSCNPVTLDEARELVVSTMANNY